MCCFSGIVNRVSSTSIFARFLGREQVLVYSMTLDTSSEVAMILPLPVDARAPALRFFSLEGYSVLFRDLERCFPVEVSRGAPAFRAPVPQPAPIPVVRVGAFEASFVPRIADFERLDPRFRLDPAVFARLPGYADYGFAVFQLRAGKTEVHPMAFAFTTRFPGKLFFPTVHVHDRSVPARAKFDHSLYAQTGGVGAKGWTLGSVLPGAVMQLDRLAMDGGSLVEPNEPVARLELRDTRANADTWLALG